jgi:hypothetical protein
MSKILHFRKDMQSWFFGLAIILVVSILPSCGKFKDSCVSGVGEIKFEEITVSGDFSAVENRTFINVRLNQGPYQPVEVTAQQNVIDMLNFEVIDDLLIIYTDRCIFDAATSTIIVQMPDLQAINLVGVGDVEVGQFTDLKDIFVASSGTGRLSFLTELTGLEDVAVVMLGAGEVDLLFQANNFFAEMNGAGDLTTGGSVRGQELILRSAGSYRGFGMASDSCLVQLAQSANAEVNVQEYLNVNLGGSGNVTYIGDPQINTIITGEGEVIDGN